MKEKWNNYYKLIRVIKSCKTKDHLLYAKKYYRLWQFENNEYYGSVMEREASYTLEVQELTIMYLEDQKRQN